MGFITIKTREDKTWLLCRHSLTLEGVRHKSTSRNHAMADVMKIDLLWNIRRSLENMGINLRFLKNVPDVQMGEEGI